MSIHAIHQYHKEVEDIIHYGGTKKETAIRNAFYRLLNDYARPKGLILVAEVSTKTKEGKTVTPDGTLKDSLRQDWGYWESKDEADNIDEEIAKKFAKGYPNDNILFEDSAHAVLFQHGAEVMRVSMKEEAELDKIIHVFLDYERPEVKTFREAIGHFKEDIPNVTAALRELIDAQEENPAYVKKREEFLELCKEAINPDVNADDVKEMMIQHILTADIFNTIFDEPHFHRENNVAKELETVVETFFTRALRQQTLNRIKHYYDTINATAAGIADHHEKQKFLKVVYETFYKSYNPKAADRLGVVYTPNEIVRFMIESTDYLLHKHFGKFLEDKGVEILDPATGTGTFICDIIDHIRRDKLEHKYKHELHANEVAILPYYISNLNIEFTYKQKMGQYAEFENLCFMDTLDNLGFKRARQNDLFNPFTEENSKRIMRQNSKKISVVIGNPPYYANQANENDNNKNREYLEIDQRISDTYAKLSEASNKANLYDMYTRFFRWASDRLDKNGILVFVSNNSFINSKSYDGFRKSAIVDFNEIHIVNLKGNARTSGERRRQEGGNVFSDEIRVGIAVYFFIKKEGKKGCDVYYNEIEDYAKAERKKAYLSENKITELIFEHIIPNKKGDWINQADNDFEKLIPLFDEKVKSGSSEKAIFCLYSLGVNTNRDEWIYDFNKDSLNSKMNYFIDKYNSYVNQGVNTYPEDIKWSSSLKNYFERGLTGRYNDSFIRRTMFRPFVKVYHYTEKIFNHRLTDNHFQTFGKELNRLNKLIAINTNGKDFWVLPSSINIDLHFTGDSQYIPLYKYDDKGNSIGNITDWGLEQFTKKYKNKNISKEDVFHYVYAVLHNPVYREKYALNLKRDFPRIPLYKDFEKWAAWGKQLMDLHINYETVLPALITEVATGEVDNPKTKLKADKEAGVIVLDDNTKLTGIPASAWEYKLGNRSALEWILDQYKESKPKDPTIAAKFNTYKFADYKTQVIDLLKRVTTVSVETMQVIEAMKAETE